MPPCLAAQWTVTCQELVSDSRVCLHHRTQGMPGAGHYSKSDGGDGVGVLCMARGFGGP
jgi:hypothetical protein